MPDILKQPTILILSVIGLLLIPGLGLLQSPVAKAEEQVIISEQTQKPPSKTNSLKALREEAARKASENNQTITRRNLQNSQTTTGYYSQIKGWMARKQAEISRTLSSYLEQFKATNDYYFAALLIGASLLYGLVHAAGPGHGKVVVSSYVMANNQTMRRGIFLAFLSAFTQATVAIALVGSLAFIFNANGATIKKFGLHMTQASFLLIAALGAYLLAIALYRRFYQKPVAAGHSQHSAGHHHHTHDEDCGCGHVHIPGADKVKGKWDTAKVISLVLSVGLRPCTGALYVLAFALIKGVFWVGALAVYAMGLGTAITISLMTMAVVAGRDVAVFSTAKNSRAVSVIYDITVIGGALIILLFGLLLFSSSLGPVRPF